jgi:hypothetical protein
MQVYEKVTRRRRKKKEERMQRGKKEIRRYEMAWLVKGYAQRGLTYELNKRFRILMSICNLVKA